MQRATKLQKVLYQEIKVSLGLLEQVGRLIHVHAHGNHIAVELAFLSDTRQDLESVIADFQIDKVQQAIIRAEFCQERLNSLVAESESAESFGESNAWFDDVQWISEDQVAGMVRECIAAWPFYSHHRTDLQAILNQCDSVDRACEEIRKHYAAEVAARGHMKYLRRRGIYRYCNKYILANADMYILATENLLSALHEYFGPSSGHVKMRHLTFTVDWWRESAKRYKCSFKQLRKLQNRCNAMIWAAAEIQRWYLAKCKRNLFQLLASKIELVLADVRKDREQDAD